MSPPPERQGADADDARRRLYGSFGPTPFDRALAAYGAAWNEPDPAARAVHVAAAFAPDGRFTDAQVRLESRSALHRHIGAVHARHPGARFVLTALPQTDDDTLRFTWAMLGADGRRAVTGCAVATLGGDGLFRAVVAAFDAPPGEAGSAG